MKSERKAATRSRRTLNITKESGFHCMSSKKIPKVHKERGRAPVTGH